MNPLHPRMLCYQDWLVLEKKILNFVNVFSLFRNYLPLENGRALHLIKLESPSPKDTLSAVWLKLSKLCWRRRFFNFVNVFSLFRNYVPLEKGGAPSFKQTWIPFTRGCFVPSLVEIGPVVLDKKMKMWKVYRRTDRQTTDDRWSEKLTWAFSSGELKTIQWEIVITKRKGGSRRIEGNIWWELLELRKILTKHAVVFQRALCECEGRDPLGAGEKGNWLKKITGT